MTDGVPRSQLVLYAAAALVIALLGARYLGSSGGSGGGASAGPAAAATVPAARVERAPGQAAVVHVAGAVRRPGVYRMRPGSRIDDAVRRAGGPTGRADLGAVNLAAKVEDGRQVLVPERPPAPADGAGASSSASTAPGAAPAPGRSISLNTATLEQLDTLPGVGPATAEKILAYREERGGFGSVEELGEVPGIGEKRLASLKELVTA